MSIFYQPAVKAKKLVNSKENTFKADILTLF